MRSSGSRPFSTRSPLAFALVAASVIATIATIIRVWPLLVVFSSRGLARLYQEPAYRDELWASNVSFIPPDQRRPLVLAWLNAWAGAENILLEPVVTALTKATGLPVVLRDPSVGAIGIRAASDAAAEEVNVFLVASLGSKDDVRAAMARHGHRALFIWWGSEAGEDNYVDAVHVSFGQARHPVNELCVQAHESPNFKRMPYWMTHAVYGAAVPASPGGLECRLDARLYAQTDPEEWAARPGFAVHVAGHSGWPRPGLVSMFTSLAHELNAVLPAPGGTRSVDVFGGTPLRNSEWPQGVPDDGHRGGGKVELARRYRFAMQPENAQVRGRPG